MMIEQMLQMLNQTKHMISPLNAKKIQLQENFLVNSHEFDSYSNEIKHIFESIFVSCKDSEQHKNMQIAMDLKSHFQYQPTPMPVCNKILAYKQPIFRCYDCKLHEGSVLCKKCFQNGSHKGHRYSQTQSEGGNCDCGNPEALKSQGFCFDHPGKAGPVVLDEKEKKHFFEVIGVIFEWIFRLHEKQKSKSSDILGQYLGEFLLKINEKSLIYNTLTFNLLFSNRKYAEKMIDKDKKIIDKILEYGVKLINFAKKMTDTFLSMFSLEIFKQQLIISYIEADNTVVNFEKSKYNSLFIQLFANNQILDKILSTNKLILYPIKSQYSYDQYFKNLIFIGSIKKQVATHFFTLLMDKGIIRFPQLDIIEQKVQKNKQHIILITNNHLNSQNYYYILLQKIIQLLNNNLILFKILNNYIDIIMSDQYSYNRNKIVMPFHKILSLILLAICKGDIQQINTQFLINIIDKKYSIKDLFIRIFKLIMKCWGQFAMTFFQSTYFNNYLPLYAKNGQIIIVFDMLMFSICLKVFNQCLNQNQMNQLLLEAFGISKLTQINYLHNLSDQLNSFKENDFELQEEQVQLQHFQNELEQLSQFNKQINEQSQQIEEQQDNNKKMKKIIELIRIMIQGCISERFEIILTNKIGIKNQKNQNLTKKLFIEVMYNFKQLTTQDLKSLLINFFQTFKLQENIFSDFLIFDKNKKKYTLNLSQAEKISVGNRIPLFLYPTIKKFGEFLAESIKQPDQIQLQTLQIPKVKQKYLKLVFNDKFITIMSNYFLNQLIQYNKKQNKQLQKIFLDYMNIIKILKYLMKNQSNFAITQLYKKIKELSQQKQFLFLNSALNEKSKQQSKSSEKLEKQLKFEEKKKKKLEKIKKSQESYNHMLESKKQQISQNQSICLICHQNNSQGLCFLSKFAYSYNLQIINKAKGRSLIFDSCFHPIHIKCFNKVASQRNLSCPLCKSDSNIMLPLQKQFSDKATMKNVYERIIILKAVIDEDYKEFDQKFQQFAVLSFFRSLSAMIGRNLLKNQPILNQKEQRLANIIYNLAKSVLLTGQKYQQDYVNNFEKLLQINIKKNQNLLTSSNYYAVQYVIISILNKCFTQNSKECQLILKSEQSRLIHPSDLRKIWQMCNQIVSLPPFKQAQKQAMLKPMNSVVQFFQPPENIFQLIRLRDMKEFSCKNTHQMCICIICKSNHCLECRDSINHFESVHLKQGISFNLLTGGLVYIRGLNKILNFPSLYSNNMGCYWKPFKSLQGFELDKSTYDQLKQSIVDEKIQNFLKKKYPEVINGNALFNINLF